MRKIIILLIAVAALAGCGDERPQAEKKPQEITAKLIDPKDLKIDSLEKEVIEQNRENLKLKTEVDQWKEKAEKLTERLSQKYLDEEAVALATACDWLIPVCPTATVQSGRDLIAKGHAVPDADLHTLMMRKGGFLLMLASVFFLVTSAVWALLTRPSLAKRQQAVEDVQKASRATEMARTESDEMIRTAHEEAYQIMGEAREKANSFVSAAEKGAVKEARRQESELLKQVALKEEKLKVLETQIESLQAEHEEAKKAAKEAQKEAAAKAQEVAKIDALIAERKAIADALNSFDR